MNNNLVYYRPEKKKRIESIDILRGLVMVIMALDHVRYYFHHDVFFFHSTDISQTTPILFFTRFITHFCAPVFLFLSGTSAFIVSRKKSKSELTTWLLKRGFWLIFISFTIEKFGWSFNFDILSFDLAVLWSLGASMIILAFAHYIPSRAAITLAILILIFQHLFDGYRPEAENIISNIWRILHVPGSFKVAGLNISVAFPLLPWTATMVLGFFAGKLFTNFTKEQRRQTLILLGYTALISFFILRFINIYGDQHPWQSYDSALKAILSFINISKAPASLDFILVTIGGALLFLAYIENVKNKFTDFLMIFGRTPFMFYLLHIYLIHAGAMVLGNFQGYDLGALDGWISAQKYLQGYGVNLFFVYLIWIILTIGTYPICKKWYRYKLNHNNFISKYL